MRLASEIKAIATTVGIGSKGGGGRGKREEVWGRVLSQHSPLASLHIDTNQSAGKPTYLPINSPLQPTEKFFFLAKSALSKCNWNFIRLSIDSSMSFREITIPNSIISLEYSILLPNTENISNWVQSIFLYFLCNILQTSLDLHVLL